MMWEQIRSFMILECSWARILYDPLRWIMDIHLQHDLVNVRDNVLMIQTVDMMGGPNRGCNFRPK